jgi:hypothetical protein
MTKMPLTLPGICFLLCLGACQNEPAADEKPKTLFADFFVRYIEPQNEYKASASFLEGDSLGNAKSVAVSGAVHFQGKPLEGRRLPTDVVRYSTTYRRSYQATHRFKFTGPQGKAREAELLLPPIDTFEVINGRASLRDGMEVYLPDGALGDEERLVFLFSDENNKAHSITIPGPVRQDTFFLHPLRLRKLKPGPHTLYLVRKSSLQKGDQALKIRGEIEYYSDIQEFEVVE